jgi:hypothetical protein
MAALSTDTFLARPRDLTTRDLALDADIAVPAFRPLEPAAGAGLAWIEPQKAHFGLEYTTVSLDHEKVGYFPVARQDFRFGWPCPVLASWKTPFSFAGTPLIDEGYADAALEGFLNTKGIAAFVFGGIPANGPFWDKLNETAERLEAPIKIMSRWQRAALRPRTSFETWFETNFERKRRKEFRRLRNRLAEQGRLESRVFTPGDRLETWTDELLALEAKGWKGRRGTALAPDPQAVRCLHDCLKNLETEGSLRFWKLAFDGKPVAMMFALVQNSQAWLAKIAYDEDLSKYSPGVLLVLDATEKLMSEPQIKLVDSCAIPGHPMIDHIWRDRIEMCDVLIGRPSTSRAKFKAMSTAEGLRRSAYATARDIYYRLTKRHRS